MDEERTYEDGSPFYTLEETIQNYYNVGALMEESDLGVLAWLEELRDLRKILTKKPPEEILDELTNEDGPITLKAIVEEFDNIAAQDPAEHIVNFWMKQLLEAQERVKEDNIP